MIPHGENEQPVIQPANNRRDTTIYPNPNPNPEKNTPSEKKDPAVGTPAPRKSKSAGERNEKYREFSRKFYKFVADEHGGKRNRSRDEIEKASNCIRLLVETDMFDFESEIKPALRWAVLDEFWKGQVQSLAALRKKSKGNPDHKFTMIFGKFAQNRPKNVNGTKNVPKFKHDPMADMMPGMRD